MTIFNVFSEISRVAGRKLKVDPVLDKLGQSSSNLVLLTFYYEIFRIF
jgi:hypothetical protein